MLSNNYNIKNIFDYINYFSVTAKQYKQNRIYLTMDYFGSSLVMTTYFVIASVNETIKTKHAKKVRDMIYMPLTAHNIN